MKERRHHNNKGYRQIKNGKVVKSLKRIAVRLGIPYGKESKMEMVSVKSSNLESVGYDPEAKKLRVKFKNGGLYEYPNFKQNEFDSFMKAESFGKYFHKHIRLRSYKKIDVLDEKRETGRGDLK